MTATRRLAAIPSRWTLGWSPGVVAADLSIWPINRLDRILKLATTKPELKQFADLSPADFCRHPVWIACHTEDHAEPWFDETDEETFRPWLGALPVSPSDGTFLVRATFELQDGSRHDGFLTPAFKKGDPGMLHPYLLWVARVSDFGAACLGFAPISEWRFIGLLGKVRRLSSRYGSARTPIWRRVLWQGRSMGFTAGRPIPQ